ncbi:CinA family protein [Amorphus sp. MBR-141]
MTTSATLIASATSLLQLCRERGVMLATAESCTGGLIAATLTEVAGSSDVVDRGFVTYSNAAKRELLGVAADLIEEQGAVSEGVVRAMAKGALARSIADVTVAVSGVAGPGGGTEEKPVGLVHFAVARTGRPTLHRERRFGDVGRAQVRLETVAEAFALIEQTLAG